MNLKKQLLTCLFGFFIAVCNAQWSDDPQVNTLINGESGEQAVPHIRTTSDGNFYMSWYSNASGNYDVYLHYINAFGEAIWNEPLLVSDNYQNTWVTDYALAVDKEDNAIVAFNDVRNGDLDIFIYKINPAGEMQWGDNGIQLSNSTLDDYVPHLAITDNNNVAVAWSSPSDSTIMLQKLAPDGSFLWGTNGMAIEPEGNYYNDYPYLTVMNGEKIYFNYSQVTGPYWAPDRDMFMRLLDDAGNNIWSDEISVFDAGGLSGLTHLSTFLTEEKIFCFAWYDDRQSNMISDSYLQCIDSTGTMLFQSNGILLSNSTNTNQFGPVIAGKTTNDEFIVLWTETDADQNNRGVYGQKVSADATLNWGDNGTAFNSVGSVVNFVDCKMDDESIIYFYNKQLSIYDGIYAHSIDVNGDFIWAGEVAVASTDKLKSHTDMAVGTPLDQIVLVWGEERNSSRDIYAQNINFDGTLGVGSIVWEAEITAYSINGINGEIDEVNREITIDLGDVDTTYFISEFTLSDGATAFINSEEQISGTTNNEFLSDIPVNYSVVSYDNSVTNNWQVTVTYNHIGIDEMKESINIYPNPADDYLQIENCLNEKITIKNVTGLKVKELISSSSTTLINISDLKSGLYILEINSSNIQKKIVVKH